MQINLYFIVFVIVLLFSILFYIKYPNEIREFFDINLTSKSNLKTRTHIEESKVGKKVKFLNTGLERVIDIDGNITDKPIYIDVG